MEKESYSVDDILSEVKKRREEQEKALKNNADNAADNEKKPTPQKEEPKKQPKEKETSFKIAEKNAPRPKADEKSGAAGEQNDSGESVQKKQAEKSQAKKQDKKPEKKDDSAQAKGKDKGEKKDTAEKSDKKDEKDENNALAQSAEPESQNGMVHILHYADEAAVEPQPVQEKPVKEKFFKTKKGKILKAVIIVLVVVIVALAVAAAVYINGMLNKVSDTDNEPYETVEYYDGMDFLQEDFPLIQEQSAGEVYSYKEYLKYWYQNGDPVRSSHVMNILLIGEDTRDEEISDASRADSAIIMSINIDTGVIHLTSVLRDLYVYYEVNGEGYYGKINEAASNGGMNTYINTIERYYKMAIDNYAIVNFASFPKIIDALGGVSVALTDAEVYEVNNHPNRYANVTLPEAQYGEDGEPQKVMLTGEQALAYCRIRKIDSDNARADRQKTVLTQLFSDVSKDGGTVDVLKVVNQLSSYTKTGFTKTELIEIGRLALRDGWLNYKIQTSNVPKTENSRGGQYFSVSYNNWIWLADIPKDAYELQMAIYGKSNIQLSENRPDYISMGL